MRKRFLAFAVAVVALSACTPEQLVTFEQVTGRAFSDGERESIVALPDARMSVGDGRMIEVDGSVTPAPAVRVSGPCSQWHDTAIAVGYTERLWQRMKFIMYRESRCQPDAYNRHGGASGLVQIMPMWADDCGGSRASLFNPAFNLACSLHILDVQGWSAWAL